MITKETPLVWVVEGKPAVGTLRDWAHDQEHSLYDGASVSRKVWHREGGQWYELEPEEINHYTDEHTSAVTYQLGDAEAIVSIDPLA